MGGCAGIWRWWPRAMSASSAGSMPGCHGAGRPGPAASVEAEHQAVAGALELGLGTAREHRGAHVGEHDAPRLEARSGRAHRRVVEVEAQLAVERVRLAHEAVGVASSL